MNKISAGKLKVVKILHLIVISMWVGSGLCLGFVSWLGSTLMKSEVHSVYLLMKALDTHLIMPLVIGTLITGLIFGIFTKWGFFKHRWITVKWIVLIIQIVIGSRILAPSIQQNASGVLTNVAFLQNQFMIHIASSVQFVLLLFVISISVLKPWKKIETLNPSKPQSGM